MKEFSQNINANSSILLSRNHPIAVVVGAAGFIGSHLTEKLLDLGVQVIGIDNLETGRKQNIETSFRHKNFHFLHQSIEDSIIEENLQDLPRLDYAVFVAENSLNSTLYKNGLPNFLKIVKKYKKGEDNFKTERPKVVFMSSITIYNSSPEGRLNYLRSAENQFAKFIKSHGLNGRIVRLAEVFGPRMHFRQGDSLSRLIRLKMEGKLNRDEGVLDFSSRGLFIDDAVALILKSILSGSTSGKIFDGCLLAPVKIEEIKQVLLDPDWYLEQGFLYTLLPPWPTPNLNYAIKDLSWKPRTSLIEALKATLQYFEQNPEAKTFALEQKRELEQTKIKGWTFANVEDGEVKTARKKTKNHTFPLGLITVFLVILLGVFYPVVSFGIGSFSLSKSLNQTRQDVENGDVVRASKDLEYSKINNNQMSNLLPVLIALNSSNAMGESRQVENLLSAQKKEINGIDQILQGLQQSLRQVLQPGNGGNGYFTKAQSELAQSLAILDDDQLQQSSLIFNKALIDQSTLHYFYNLAEKGRRVSQVWSLIFNQNSKTYLVLITDSANLQASGGKINQIGELNYSAGNFVWQNLQSVVSLDQQLQQKNILLSQNNANTKAQFSSLNQADFPTQAQNAKVIYQALTNRSVDGVIMIDQTILQKFNQEVGNTTAEYSDFGSIIPQLLAQSHFFQTAQVLDQALNQKQLLIYSFDAQAESGINNLGWSNALVPTASNPNWVDDFLGVLENNHSSTSNYNIKRKFLLQTTITEDGNITHNLTVNYQNQGSQVYQSNLELVLPLGTKLITAQSGGEELPFSSSSDFGRAIYQGEISVNSGSKQLVIQLSLPSKIGMEDDHGGYRLRIDKQSGSSAEEFAWQLNYPYSWDLLSQSRGVDINKHQINLAITLDSDQTFDLAFKKH